MTTGYKMNFPYPRTEFLNRSKPVMKIIPVTITTLINELINLGFCFFGFIIYIAAAISYRLSPPKSLQNRSAALNIYPNKCSNLLDKIL